RAGLVERHHSFFAEQRIGERRLADVWPADDRDLDPPIDVAMRRRDILRGCRSARERFVDQPANIFTMRGGYGERRSESELVKVGDCALRLEPFGFVYRKNDGTSRATQQVRERTVLRRNARARI